MVYMYAEQLVWDKIFSLIMMGTIVMITMMILVKVIMMVNDDSYLLY